jgi:NTP pyrophosphatase (non-canonical NTP hydrolase)
MTTATPVQIGNLRELQKKAFDHSESKGFHDDDDLGEVARRILDIGYHRPLPDDVQTFIDGIQATWKEMHAAKRLLLIVSEVSEAYEALREVGHFRGWTSPTGKPEGVPSELADILVRTAEFAETVRIDVQGATEEKMTYNSTRPHKHGKRF